VKDEPRFIVAEVSKTWQGELEADPSDTIAARFQLVLGVNAKRGYTLHSWRFVQTLNPLAAHDCAGTIAPTLTETIVAVFERLRSVDVEHARGSVTR
jgi:hypothetical protein